MKDALFFYQKNNDISIYLLALYFSISINTPKKKIAFFFSSTQKIAFFA